MKISAIKNYNFANRIQNFGSTSPIKKEEEVPEKAVAPLNPELAGEIDELFNVAKNMKATSVSTIDTVQNEIEEITRTYKSEVKEALKLFREAGEGVETTEEGIKIIREFDENNNPKRNLTLYPDESLTIDKFDDNVVVRAQKHELLSVLQEGEKIDEGTKYSFLIEYENGVPQSYVKNYTETKDGKITAEKKFEFTHGVVTPFRYRENYASAGDSTSADKQVQFKYGGFNIYDLLSKGILFRWADLIREYDENINYGKDFWTIEKAITFVDGNMEKYAENTTHMIGSGDKSDKQILFKDNKPDLYFDSVTHAPYETRKVENTYALENGEWVASNRWHT